jgi:predicted RND superfamily exporter protein
MQRLTGIIFRFRKAIIAVTALLTLFLGFQCLKITVNSDVVQYLPKEDNAVVLYNKVGDLFGGNDLALIALRSDDVFSPATIRDVNILTQKFRQVSGVSSVLSLTDIIDIRKGADGSVEVGKLIDPYNVPAIGRTELDQDAGIRAGQGLLPGPAGLRATARPR